MARVREEVHMLGRGAYFCCSGMVLMETYFRLNSFEIYFIIV